MNRFLPILLCLLVGCGSANASFLANPLNPPKAKPTTTFRATAVTPVRIDPVAPTVYTVSLPEKLEGRIGVPIILTAVTNADSVSWIDDPDDDLWVMPAGMLSDNYKLATMIIPLAPGDQKIMAAVSTDKNPALSNWCVISVQGAQPPPDPNPVPPPPAPVPPPQPPKPVLTQNLIIYTFEDATARTPALAKMLFDPYWINLKIKGHSYEKFNITSPAATVFKDWIAQAGGVPCIIIMDAATRKVLNKDPADMKLPATTAALQARISKFTGNLP